MVVKHRERVLNALEHFEPDRVPLNFPHSGKPDPLRELIEKLGVKDREGLLKKLDVDLRTAHMGVSEEFKSKSTHDPSGSLGPVIELPGGIYEDPWGVRYKVGATGVYTHIVYNPLKKVDIDEYDFPSLNDPGLFTEAEKLIPIWKEKFAVAASTNFIYERSWHLKGFREFIRDLYTNEKFVNKLLDRMFKYTLEQGKRFIEMGVDIIRLGDDIGIQTGMLLSPKIWRKYFKTRMSSLIKEFKKYSDIFVFYHSDGNFMSVLPDLVEIGVDIIDPVQPECMDLMRIKELYGDRLTLHGTISQQETLPFGSVKDVKEEIINRIETLSRGGGLILEVRSLQPDVPIENFLAVYETVEKYRRTK